MRCKNLANPSSRGRVRAVCVCVVQHPGLPGIGLLFRGEGSSRLLVGSSYDLHRLSVPCFQSSRHTFEAPSVLPPTRAVPLNKRTCVASLRSNSTQPSPAVEPPGHTSIRRGAWPESRLPLHPARPYKRPMRALSLSGTVHTRPEPEPVMRALRTPHTRSRPVLCDVRRCAQSTPIGRDHRWSRRRLRKSFGCAERFVQLRASWLQPIGRFQMRHSSLSGPEYRTRTLLLGLAGWLVKAQADEGSVAAAGRCTLFLRGQTSTLPVTAPQRARVRPDRRARVLQRKQ